MTPANAYPCPRCGFRQDPPHPIHLRNCVPVSQWPEEARLRKAASLTGQPVAAYEVPAGVPGRNRLVRDDELDPEFATEVVSRRDARAARSLATHHTVEPSRERITTVQVRPVFSSEVKFGPVVKHSTQPDDLGPEVFERARARKAAYDAKQPENQTKESNADKPWWADMRETPDPEPDAEELADFVGVSTEARLQQEAETERLRLETDRVTIVTVGPVTVADYANPLACLTCGRVSKSKAGNAAHQRSHRVVEVVF